MSESKSAAPGSSNIDEEVIFMEGLIKGHEGPVMGLFNEVRGFVESRGVKMDKLAEVLNDTDNSAAADRIAAVFSGKFDGTKRHRKNPEKIPTYQKAEATMISIDSPALLIQPREAAVFLHQICVLLSQYGMKPEEVFQVIEHNHEHLGEAVAEAIKPTQNKKVEDEHGESEARTHEGGAH